jgi:uncharacterized protein YrrD
VKPLLRGSDLVGLPVVTMAGDDIAEVRDVLFDPGVGGLIGFTLNKRGRLAGRLKESLLRAGVAAIGPDAIMVAGPDALTSEPPPSGEAGTGNVLKNQVITDAGVQVGTVTDVVIDTSVGSVVGYEVAPADEPAGRKGRRSYLPLPDTGAVSGEALVVPAAAVDYVTSDLAGFAEAIERYRALLHGGAP